MQFYQASEVSTQTDSPRESCSSKGVGRGAMHAELVEDTGVNMSNAQLQAAERAQHLEIENAELRQQLTAMESRYDSNRQLTESQATELAEKSQVIEALQSKLMRLSTLAEAFANEVHGANHVRGMPAHPSFAARQAEQQQTAAAAAPQQKPAVPAATPVQQINLPAAMAVLSRLHQQHQHQQNASVVASAAGADAAGIRLPSAGSKRGRLCSATGSGCDATKHAASGGSSSSHQQLSADEELDEDMDDDDDELDDEEEATAGYISAKRARSPNSCERLAQPAADVAAGAAGAAAAAEHMDAADDDKSQDDLDAAQCLQQLAMSAGSAEARGTNHTGMPSLFDSLSNSDRFAAGRGAASNLARWGSSGQAPAAPPGADAGPAAAYAGSSSSNGSGGNVVGNSSTFNQVVQAHLLNYLGALNPEGFEGFHNPRAQQQGTQAVQEKRLSLPFGSAQQQAVQPHQQHRQQHFGAGAGGLMMQRSGSMGASWSAAAAKSAPAAPAAPAGSMAAPARARKQSWFQTEIAEKIPLSVQQACAHDWAAQQCMQVVCADLVGTFYVNSAGEYLIKLGHSGEVVTPNKFEELAGKKTARNWQQSIRLVGYTMNGEPSSALLKLGHFTRIVGLVQDR